MGDCIIMTNNKILVENTLNLPPIHCLQRKAEKKIPSEDDIYESNIKSFGNAVGSVTNKSTAMFEVRARFPKDCREYEILSYRIKCIQQGQQNEIDKTKGIVAKPLPKHWYDWFATKIEEGDDEELIEWKKFQRSIVADKKPYFFRYVYPIENTRWLDYQKNSNTKAIMQFGLDLEELKSSEIMNEEKDLFLENYYSHLPLGIAPCTINRICWKIENEFKSENMAKVEPFDYNLLKAPKINYDTDEYSSILAVYKEYISNRRKIDSITHCQKTDDFDRNAMNNMIISHFKRQCTILVPDKKKLCNIILDVCYRDSNTSKRFVWDICGDIIIDNLLERKKNCISYPVQCDIGTTEFGGRRFYIETLKLAENNE